jgi:hypothetical protein
MLTRFSPVLLAGGSNQEGKAILIAKATKPIDIGMLDNLLGSKLNGPITQIVHQKERKVALTFSDAVSRAAAKKILESSKDCKEILKTVS